MQDKLTVRDEWLCRIGEHIFHAWELGVIDFQTCEDSLGSLNSLTDEVWLAIPEPERYTE